MRRLHGKVGIYDVYIDDVFYKTTVLDVVAKEFEISRTSVASKRIWNRNGKVVRLEKRGIAKDFLEDSVYRNDDLLGIGTTEELMDILGLKEATLNFYKSKKENWNTYCDCIGFNEDELGEVDIGDYEF